MPDPNWIAQDLAHDVEMLSEQTNKVINMLVLVNVALYTMLLIYIVKLIIRWLCPAPVPQCPHHSVEPADPENKQQNKMNSSATPSQQRQQQHKEDDRAGQDGDQQRPLKSSVTADTDISDEPTCALESVLPLRTTTRYAPEDEIRLDSASISPVKSTCCNEVII